MMTAIIGMAGLAVEGGRLYWTKKRMQAAADAAAFAGALEVHRGHLSYAQFIKPAALRDATLNGFTNPGATVTVNNPPTSGSRTGDSNFVEVIIQQTLPTLFTRVLGREASTVRARSVSGKVKYLDVCFLALNPTASDALYIHGDADMTANCGLMSNSTSGTSFAVGGSLTINTKWNGSSGYFSQSGSVGTVNPPVDQLTPPYPDPMSYLVPPPYTGWPNAQWNNGQKRYSCGNSPGCVFQNKETISGNYDVTFEPGIYVFKNGLTITSNNAVYASGVMFYFLTGGLSIQGSSQLYLTPPLSGFYKSVALYINPSAATQLVSLGQGSATFQFRGVLYAPSMDVRLRGGFIGSNPWGMVIGNTVDFAGTSPMTLQKPPDLETPEVYVVMQVE